MDVGPLALTATAAVAGLLGFVVRYSLDQLRAAEERLSPERRKVYGDLLSPYVRLLASQSNADETENAEVLAKITSFEYRQTAFDFMLVAPDKVATAYVNLVQFTFKAAGKPEAPSGCCRCSDNSSSKSGEASEILRRE